MTIAINQPFPDNYINLKEATEIAGFTMASDVLTCSLLRSLAASKPSGKFLELGTGTGLSTSWILDGMDNNSSLISIDNEPVFLAIAKKFLANDSRLDLVFSDGGEWIEKNKYEKFDYIFADTWHGKYLLLDETLNMLNKGGFYIIDDMLQQSNWPEGHQEKVISLMNYLETRNDFVITGLNWASGIIIAVKK